MKTDKRFIKILFTQKEIEDKIVELGKWVDETYSDSKDLVLVALLKGSIPFFAQLIKSITIEHSHDFMIASSYHGDVKSSGNVKIITDLSTDIKNKDILLVEDIIDSGISLSKIVETLKTRNPKSIKIITLLNKEAGRKADIKADKYGFNVPNEFLAGYGLDVKEKMRNVPYIGVFNKDYFDKL